MELLIKGTDPVTAATRAFGDLKPVEAALQVYIRQERFFDFKVPAMTEVDQSAFEVEALAPAQADALRADFLACNDRTADARALLERVLKDDPNNVSAHETMGLLEFRQGHVQEARKWYAQAVELDSQNYLAHYYFASMSMNGSTDNPEDTQVESSLRTAIKLNPSFAPPYDRLAVFLGTRHRNLDEARMMGLTAVSLEPENVGYRVNVANLLLIMGKADNAIQVLHAAEKLAKSPEEAQLVENNLMHAQAYSAAQEQIAEQNQSMEVDAKAAEAKVPGGDERPAGVPRLMQREELVARGPHRFVEGLLKDVHCNLAKIDLTVASSGKSLALHADDYFKIQFTALGFQPTGDLHPCADLEGRRAKVEYVESGKESDTARLLAVELHK